MPNWSLKGQSVKAFISPTKLGQGQTIYFKNGVVHADMHTTVAKNECINYSCNSILSKYTPVQYTTSQLYNYNFDQLNYTRVQYTAFHFYISLIHFISEQVLIVGIPQCGSRTVYPSEVILIVQCLAVKLAVCQL